MGRGPACRAVACEGGGEVYVPPLLGSWERNDLPQFKCFLASVRQFAFNLFQRFALRFRQFEMDKDESDYTDGGEQPERSRRAKHRVQSREGVDQ